MIELFRNKQYRNLLICLAALDSVQLFMLYVFWSWLFFSGTGIELEIAFIIYSAIIAITLIVVPYLMHKKHLLDNPQTLKKVTYVSICAAFASSFIALLPGVIFLCISLSLITVFIFIPHALCLVRVARELPGKLIGSVVGIVVATAMLLGYLGSFLSFEVEDTLIVYIIFTFLIAVAAFFFRPETTASKTEKADQPDFPRRFIIVGIGAAFCYAIVAGLDDNIRFIVEVTTDFEGVFNAQIVFLFGALIYLLAGYLTDTVKSPKYIILTCLIAICVVFSFLLIVDEEIMAYTYVFASMLPIYTLWVVSIVLPILLAKSIPYFAGAGYAILYLGMIPTSVMFLVSNDEDIYRLAIALVLFFTVAALVFAVNLISAYERKGYLTRINSQEVVLSLLSLKTIEEESKDDPRLNFGKIISEFGLTPREGELFHLVVSPLTANEIAESEKMSVGNAKFHIGNILSKTSCKNRRELRMMVEGGRLHGIHDITDD